MRTVTRRRFLEGSATGMAATGLGASSLCAQDWARQAVDKSPRQREWVTVKHDSRSRRIVRGLPAVAGQGARDGRDPRDFRHDRLGGERRR